MKLLKSRPPAYSADEAELPDYELERFLDGRWASRAPTVSDAGTHREVMASVEQQDWYAMHVRIGDMLHDPRQNSGTMLPDPESMNAAPEQNRSGTADAGSHVSAEQA
ncbi:hypothetical protein PsYK624_099820 [Phanerochaete sordida]|uniref:Uncharacterized protein n=1 Tax=Phanerochaete sordida TaxID=48140 RepID=A0A9P3LGN5_9APHY|nr:hypothetical protein PsYK624_099820 [Phanerochaete sordida]